MLSGTGKAFHSRLIARIQLRCGLKPRYDRLREAGLLTLQEMAKVLGITPAWAKIWHHHGLVRGHAYNDKNECLYEHPGKNPPQKATGVKLDRRVPVARVVIDCTKEVQCEA